MHKVTDVTACFAATSLKITKQTQADSNAHLVGIIQKNWKRMIHYGKKDMNGPKLPRKCQDPCMQFISLETLSFTKLMTVVLY